MTAEQITESLRKQEARERLNAELHEAGKPKVRKPGNPWNRKERRKELAWQRSKAGRDAAAKAKREAEAKKAAEAAAKAAPPPGNEQTITTTTTAEAASQSVAA